MASAYQFGIKEELVLADAETRVAPDDVEALHCDMHARMPDVERELLRAQVEIMMRPCTDFAQARFTRWFTFGFGADQPRSRHFGARFRHQPRCALEQQQPTQKDQYMKLTDAMHMLARRDAVCGMHIHVEVPQPDRRVDLMNRF